MKRNRHTAGWAARLALTALLFALLLTAGVRLFVTIDARSGEAEKEVVRSAIRTAALTCYAVEGAYPEDLDYLAEHYGLMYDRERYRVVYDAFASNVMPDIRVLEEGAGWR